MKKRQNKIVFSIHSVKALFDLFGDTSPEAIVEIRTAIVDRFVDKYAEGLAKDIIARELLDPLQEAIVVAKQSMLEGIFYDIKQVSGRNKMVLTEEAKKKPYNPR